MTEADELGKIDPMTDLTPTLVVGGEPAAAPVHMADVAARAAGVQIRTIGDLEGLDEVYRLLVGIWQPQPSAPPVTTELLRALTKAGNYVSGAFEGERIVGACIGFFGAPADGTIHSHIAGVSATAQGRNIGFALKLHQRAWALSHGASAIAWTFDPLVSRNAYFNLVKLRALPTEYLPNFYGHMNDDINGEFDSDRLLVQWELASSAVIAACSGLSAPADAQSLRASGAVVALGVSKAGGPVQGRMEGSTLLVAVPPDIEGLRRSNPGQAMDWRTSVREVLVALLNTGARVTGFDRAGWYVVSPGESPR